MSKNEEDDTHLHLCARNGHTEIVSLLIEAGAIL